MKKIVSAILLASLCLSVSGCDKDEKERREKPTELEIGTTYKIDDFAEITPIKITTSNKIMASMGSSFYENTNDGETYVDMVFDVVNIGKEVIDSEEFMEAIAKNSDGVEFEDVTYAVETDNLTYMSTYEEMIPQTISRFHASISVPETEKELTLEVEIEDKNFVIEYNTEREIKKTIPLDVGDVIGDKNYATAEFLDYKFIDKVVPSNTNGFYNYYEVGNSDNTYLAMEFLVTNYQEDEKDIDTFLSARATFMGKYKYTGFPVGEDEETSLSSYAEITPLSSMKVYYLIEVPKTVMDEDYEVSVMFNKKEYLFKNR